jgi:hypothetical protein
VARVSVQSRWVPAVEIGVLVCGLAAINRVGWPDDPGFAHVAPHPILFIALVMAARYGLGTGLLAAAAGATEYALAIAGPDKSLLLHQLGAPALAAPLIELVPTTVFVGMLIQRHIERARAAVDAEEEATSKLAEAQAELSRLRDTNIELAERIVHAETTPALLFSHVKALYALDLGELNHNLLGLLTDLLHVRGAAIWWSAEGGVRLVASVGPRGREPFTVDRRLEPAFDRDVLALGDLPAAQRPRGLPLLVGRLRAGAGGPILGYLTIDDLSLRSTVDALRMFRMLVHWMSIAIGNALSFQRLEARPTALKVLR